MTIKRIFTIALFSMCLTPATYAKAPKASIKSSTTATLETSARNTKKSSHPRASAVPTKETAPSKKTPLANTEATKQEQASADTSKKEQRKQRREKKKEKERALREKHKKPEKKLMRDMNYDELKAAKNRQLKAKDISSALRYLEKMLPMSNDPQERRSNMLELADLYFDNGELEKAGKLYNDFTHLYSGNNKVEYASYKSVLCSFYSTFSSDRDQTRTVDTIERGEKFLERSSIFITYTPEVQKIVTDCRKKLFDNQVGIFTFYFNRGRYTSAQKRLENIRKEFIPALPEAEPHLLVMEADLAAKLNNTTLAAQKQAELATKFPTYHQELVVTQNKSGHRRFVNRF
ncbi:MAG: outer membrane protein assembly factor BamD [Candidatus Babeliales bacterium]